MTKNKLKAHALAAASDTLHIGGPVAAGFTALKLLKPVNADLAFIACLFIVIGLHSMLAPMVTDVFGPTIDRLRGSSPAKTTDTAPTS